MADQTPSGARFGWLTILKAAGSDRHGKAMYRAVCDCGAVKMVRGSHLKRGTTISCGCKKQQELGERRKTHGMADHPLYNTWLSMHRRCSDVAHKNFKQYGGRGITVCDRWSGRDGIANFVADMGERPDGYTLDRIDSDGNYEPSNCRWATDAEQRANQRPRGAYATTAVNEAGL